MSNYNMIYYNKVHDHFVAQQGGNVYSKSRPWANGSSWKSCES